METGPTDSGAPGLDVLRTTHCFRIGEVMHASTSRIHVRRSRALWTISLLLVGIVFIASGCQQKPGNSPTRGTVDTRRFPRPTLESVSEEEAERVGRAFAKFMSQRDYDAVYALFDLDQLVDLACYGFDPESRFRRDFVKGFNKNRHDYVRNLAVGLQDMPFVTCLRIVEKKGVQHAVIRLHGSETSFTYLNLIIAKRPSGHAAIVDLVPVAVGEAQSRTIRRFFLAAVASASRSIVERLTKQDNEVVENLSKIQQIVLSRQQGDDAEALRIYDSLPESLRMSKLFLSIALSASINLEKLERHQQLVDEYRRRYPDDVTADMILIDYYAIKENHAEMLKAIDRIDKGIGGDPFLDLIRAQAKLGEQDWTAARKLAQSVIDDVPNARYAYWTAFEAAFQLKDNADATRQLKVLFEDFGVEVRDLESEPDYKELTDSAEYQEFARKLPPRQS